MIFKDDRKNVDFEEAFNSFIVDLRKIKNIMWRGLHKMKDTNLKMDNDFICMTILCLIKLRQIDPEGDREGILVAPRKKPRKVRKVLSI